MIHNGKKVTNDLLFPCCKSPDGYLHADDCKRFWPGGGLRTTMTQTDDTFRCAKCKHEKPRTELVEVSAGQEVENWCTVCEPNFKTHDTVATYHDNPEKSRFVQWDVQIICNACGGRLSAIGLTPDELHAQHVADKMCNV